MTVFNDILIPRFKERSRWIISTPARAVRVLCRLLHRVVGVFHHPATTSDPIARMGIKTACHAVDLRHGQRLFWPRRPCSLSALSAGLFMSGWVRMLQIAANPYDVLGPERTASSRLNLAQAFNSVGTRSGIDWCYLIFQYFAKTGAHEPTRQGAYLPSASCSDSGIVFLHPPAACRKAN